jgi:glutamine amidotransferase
VSRVGIIDYGMGNLHSVQKALQEVGAESQLVSRPALLAEFDRLILPGVGAFGDAMENLRSMNLVEPIMEAIDRGIPLLGICLGMQILFTESEEMGSHKGLGVISGSVRYLRVTGKVPHMGWNQLSIRTPGPLLANIRDGAFVYFANSYVVQPDDPAVVAAETEYEARFPAVVWRENLYGVQFHPEKSQRTGLHILRNFVEQC